MLNRSLARFLLILMVAVCLAAPCLGQGTQGSLPDPITARELDGYMSRLNLSEQQRQAVALMHEGYREEFRALRETDIQKFLEAGHQFDMGVIFRPRADVEKGLRELESILSKIRGVDDRFLDQIAAVLSEEQTPMLQRVRQTRERVRYRSGLTRITRFTNPAAQIDLVDLAYDLDLAPEEKAAFDPLLAQYETSLTSACKRLFDGSIDMVMGVLKKVEEAGITPQTPRGRDGGGGGRGGAGGGGRGGGGDPRQNVRELWTQANAGLQERSRAISDLNRSSLRNFAGALSPEHARELRTSYYVRAYKEAMDSRALARGLDEALKFDALTPEQRETITGLRLGYFAALDPIIDQMVDLIDENRATQNLLDYDREARQAFEEKMTELRDKRTALDDSTRTTLDATLGAELTEQLERRVQMGDGGGGNVVLGENVTFELVVAPAAAGGAPGEARIITTGAIRLGGDLAGQMFQISDPFVPGPISARDLDAYGKKLALDEDSRSILSSLHADYQGQYQVLEDTDIKAVREASQSQWRMGGGGQREGNIAPPTPQSVDELYAKRRTAIATILGLDSSFFDDVALALAQDAPSTAMVDRLRLARQRNVYNRGASGGDMISFSGSRGGGGGGAIRLARPGGGQGGPAMFFSGAGGFGESQESSLDLSGIVDGIDLSAAPDRKPIDAALLEYEQSVTAAFQQMFEASMRMRQATDRMMAEASQPGADGQNGGARRFEFNGEAMRRVTEEDGRAARAAQETVRTLNRQTLDALKMLLPPMLAADLQRAYNEAAFPGVYADGRSARKHVAEALNLPDLTDQQRTQIQEVAVEYTSAYDALCDEMVALITAAEADSGGGGDPRTRDWSAWQDRQREREKLEFDRNDLADRTLARLRIILSEDQVARLGGLDPQRDS